VKTSAQPRRAWLGLGVWTLCVGALAANTAINLDKRYPAGTIDTEAKAEQALADVAALRQSIEAEYKSESARCVHVFLATECQDKARRAHTLGETQAHRVEVEAHDLQRKVAAQRRATQRDAQQAQWQQEEAKRPEKEREAQRAAQQRTDKAAQDEQDRLKLQAQSPGNRERYEQRNTQHEQDEAKRADVLLRNVAENEHRYADKQAQAKAYAATRAREREENQKEREERERKRKAEAEAAGGTTEPAAETKK
jgi:colicin import membrane protein